MSKKDGTNFETQHSVSAHAICSLIKIMAMSQNSTIRKQRTTTLSTITFAHEKALFKDPGRAEKGDNPHFEK